MEFRAHSELKDQHAFLSASNYHWINYDGTKLENSFRNFLAVQKGTEFHEFACKAIRLGVKLPRSKKTLNMYVNDAIGYRMNPEQVLFYSMNCFGTADAICFRDNLLRIHDLKTGLTPASFHQLEVYMALFCLEYEEDPKKINAELRIYQSNDVKILEPDPDVIVWIMEKIQKFDPIIEKIKLEERING